MRITVISAFAAVTLAGCTTNSGVDPVTAASQSLIAACETGEADACSTLLRQSEQPGPAALQALTAYCAEVLKPDFPPLPRGKRALSVDDLVEQNRCIRYS